MKFMTLPIAACAVTLTTTALSAATPNPFAQPSTLPYQMPPFDRLTDADYGPAFNDGMAEQRREVDAIAHSSEPPTFENTIVALERSGRLLYRVRIVFTNLTFSNTDDALQKMETDLAPRLSAHQDAIFLDAALYRRVKAVYDQRASLGLDPESARLLERYHTDFVRAGAELSAAGKTHLAAYNGRLSVLTTQFKQNLLTASNAHAVVVDNVSELEGLSASDITAAAEAAKAQGLTGKWVITLVNTTGQPVLAQLTHRALRERIYRASISRSNGGAGDNTGVIAEIIKLRAERAALLGFPTHAAYVLADENAHTTTAVNKILAEIARPAVQQAQREAAAMQELIDRQALASHTPSFKLAAWDWAFYSEQVRKAKYSYDEAQVRPYFELNHVLQDGVFNTAHELYGVTFKERHDLPVYQPDVRVFEVFDSDGTPIGLFLGDYFARSNKQGGAWMSNYVDQNRLFGAKPVIVNNLNITKPPVGQPVLLTLDEVTTMFHEFGHALHGFFSNVKYPLLSGTAVPRDFVEYPSQFNEMWANNPTVLARYAKHYQTGEAMPAPLLQKVLAAQNFNQGFATTEYLAAAIFDQSWHQIPASRAPAAADVMAFEATALKDHGVDLEAVPPRYHTPYFSHIFANQYSAGYYAYLWTAVLAADTQQWFRDHGGLTRANGEVLRSKILSRGNTVDSGQLFREFYGAEPNVQPLLERRGFVQAAAPH